MSCRYLYYERPTRKEHGQLCPFPSMMERRLVEERVSVPGNGNASSVEVVRGLGINTDGALLVVNSHDPRRPKTHGR